MVQIRDTASWIQQWTAAYDEYTNIKLHKLLTVVTHEVLHIFLPTVLSSS